jgi:hypothetical protein
MSPDDAAPRSSVVLYRTEDGRTQIQCRFEGETIWLTQALIAELFQTTPQNVTQHIKAIYADGELAPGATCKDVLQVRREGSRDVTRTLRHYSLPVILAVGYRVRSPRGTQFRQWATARLEEFLVKGFTMDDERLKHPPGPGVPDYFDELLERIRDIRASERRMYLRVREILALAVDYDAKATETQEFFQVVQNKLHHAVTGMTAPELIASRADASKPNMGLTTWKGDVVRRQDIVVAKNYLREGEITELNRVVVMFLDYAEDQAKRKHAVHVSDWREKLDGFLRFNERDVLLDAGNVSRADADRKAEAEYARFETRRRAELEARGEADSVRALEEFAKRAEKRRGRRPKRSPG